MPESAQLTNGLKKHLWGGTSTVLVALLGQTIAGVWWASSITTRLERAERDLVRVEQRLHTVEIKR